PSYHTGWRAENDSFS
ncbi:hypothetical protein CPC197_1169B, partial [Chlamydia psittaci C1/97]